VPQSGTALGTEEPTDGQTSVTVRTIDANTLSSGGPPPEIDEQTGRPKQLQAYVVNSDPEVLVVPQFLSDAEVKHMVELAENLWTPSGVQVGGSKEKSQHKSRTSYSCIFQPAHDDIINSVEQRVANLAGLSTDYLEQLALVRYKPGEFFNYHHDGVQRTKTIFIYLNDLPEDAEGHTVFPNLGVQFTPRIGCAVMWPNIHEDGSEDSRLLHAGLAPLKGVKYGVNCFFNVKPLKVRGVIDGDSPVEVPLLNKEAQERKEWATVDPLEVASSGSGGDPDKTQSFVFNVDPKLAIVPNCLSPDEVAAMLRHHARTSSATMPEEDARLLGTIQAKLASVAGVAPTTQKGFQTAKYRPGVIPDGLSHTGDAEYCKRFGDMNVFVYLEDVEETHGAELRFPRLGLQVRPRVGCAVVWSTLTSSGERCLSTAHQPNELHRGSLHIALCTFGGERA